MQNNIEKFQNLDNNIEEVNSNNILETFIGEQEMQNSKLSNKSLNHIPKNLQNSNKSLNHIPENLQEILLKLKENILQEVEQKNKSKKNMNNDITYDESYVQYQKNGLEKEQNDIIYKNNLFRLENGQQSISKEFIKDGEQYYNNINSNSSSAPTAKEALDNELKYGDYNYISPINKGMANPAYTFISPNNWYPVPPHPPVCVTNKKCTTCPVQMNSGNDYMNWASLDDFDQARRFTGNMNINLDYVKNVLNNDNGN